MADWQEVEQSAQNLRLLQEAQAGNPDAYGQLYELYAPVVFRFLFAHLDDRMDAEDLTVEVFLRTWRSLNTYRDQGVPFAAFLFRIARNALIDHYRRTRKVEQPLSLEEELVSDPQAEPGEAVLENLERQEIRQILDKLREDYRTVLILRFLSDLSPEETAQIMGKSTGAVRVLQYRALAALRKLLGA